MKPSDFVMVMYLGCWVSAALFLGTAGFLTALYERRKDRTSRWTVREFLSVWGLAPFIWMAAVYTFFTETVPGWRQDVAKVWERLLDREI